MMLTYKASNLSADREDIQNGRDRHLRNMCCFISWRIDRIESDSNCRFCYEDQNSILHDQDSAPVIYVHT